MTTASGREAPSFTEGFDGFLILCCSSLAVLGSAALVVGNIVGSYLVPHHDWISDTVSDLAAGRYEIIQDVALYGFATALLACAIGAAHVHDGQKRWTGGVGCLCLLAFCVVVIGARNEYGDQDNDGLVLHIYIVIALGVLFELLFLAMAKGLGRARGIYRTISLSCAAAWGIGAPVFFFLPTGIDGLWERMLGLISVFWVLSFAYFLQDALRAGDQGSVLAPSSQGSRHSGTRT